MTLKTNGYRFATYLIVLFGCSLMHCRQSGQSTAASDWPRYSSDAAGSKYSRLDQIDPDNVHELELAWTWQADDMRQNPRTTIQCNPIIINGRVYLTTPGLKVCALDGISGTTLWTFDPYDGAEASGVNRGVTYWSDGKEERIFYVAGPFLYALNAEDGIPDLLFGQEGRVDLYEGLGRDVRSVWVTAATPGIIYNDLLILGSTLSEGPSAAAPGHIRAFDVKTGEQRWIFHTIPYPDEPGYETWPEDAWQRSGGANAWGGFTLDEDRGLVFCGTGSATYDHWGGDRIGQNLYANCVLALRAESGELVWHYQVVHHDIWDYDLPCPPNLVQVRKDGKLIDAVAQPSKMGHLFVLDRTTGEPIFPIEELPVPQSTVPGEVTWPTQPFPPKSLRYAQQRLTRDEVTDLNDLATKSVLARLDTMDVGDIFLPPSMKGAVTLPQFNGGTDWGGASYNPDTRMLFVNCSNEAEWISMVPANPPASISQFDLGSQLYSAVCASCHGFMQARAPGAPSLEGLRIIGKDSVERVEQALRYGKGQMPKFATLSQDERDALTAFVRDLGRNEVLQTKDLALTFSTQIPFVATGHNEFKDPEGFPVNKRPWGTLTAIDLDKGAIKWQVALGTYPMLEARGEPPTGTFNMGGPALTAGGVVFIGASMDQRFRAFDQETGEILWEFQLEAGAYSTPSIYAINDKQYVLIAGGGGGKPGTQAGDKYYCFALP